MILSEQLCCNFDEISYKHSKQKVIIQKKVFLESLVLQLQAWNWLFRDSLLYDMANKLLQTKDVTIRVSINWVLIFL